MRRHRVSDNKELVVSASPNPSIVPRPSYELPQRVASMQMRLHVEIQSSCLSSLLLLFVFLVVPLGGSQFGQISDVGQFQNLLSICSVASLLIVFVEILWDFLALVEPTVHKTLLDGVPSGVVVVGRHYYHRQGVRTHPLPPS